MSKLGKEIIEKMRLNTDKLEDINSAVGALLAENARLQERVEEEKGITDTATRAMERTEGERDALQARVEEAEIRLGFFESAGFPTPQDILEKIDHYKTHMGEAWQEYRRLWLRWFEQRVEYRYAKQRERENERPRRGQSGGSEK